MTGVIIFILALSVLYLLSRIFIQKLFTALLHLTNNQSKAAKLLGWIFLPGTFIHELSHFITALFLLVPVGKIKLLPEIEERGIKLGSVLIGKTDFVRGSLIGLAPLIIGGGSIIWSFTFTLSHGYLSNPWVIAGLIYGISQISNTMFSSKRDLIAVGELMIFLVIVSVVLIIFKVYGPFDFIYKSLSELNPLVEKISLYLIIPIGLEIIFLSLFRKVRIR
jgi:hypothetical protein